MVIDMINKEASGVSDDILKQVLNYLKYLKREEDVSSAPVDRSSLRDLFAKKGWISDDFDEPLADFAEYM